METSVVKTDNKEIQVFCAYDELVKTSALKPNPKNPNQHPEEQIELLGKIIEEQGWRAPVTVSIRSGLVVRGHGRLMAAQLIGCDFVPVDYQHYSSDEEELADMVADNRLAELSDMDNEILADIFRELEISGINLDLTGYVEEDRSVLISDLISEKINFDEADECIPEVEERSVSKPGDVWVLGKHRLVCGDSTKKETYQHLMRDDCAQLIVTDPPYNVNYEGTAGKIMNDSMDSDSFRAFLRDMYTAAASVTKEGAAAYVFHADGEGVAFREEFIKAGFLLKECLIWVKNSFVLGRQDYQWRHEPILYGWKAGASHYFTEARNISTVFDETCRPDIQSKSKEELAEMVELLYDKIETLESTVIYCDKPLKNAEHPTMKPTALIARLVENSSKAGWIVLDPFGGSGSTLIACEGTNRKARLIELDPKFCDVIVKRYMHVTGKRDVLLERAGKTINLAATGILD